ncbi:hypothetical protein HPB48_021750 [Haemaphysalis longicornis]|uniref:Uncharacterized protein n=1 Tax=Haemaphysalis longicornis TaxID=44386 RepID=A0A9J6FUV3_HAELO|nr:hypothetical protein HPB48_021750 [Haemaphysalis longicornis]
MEYTVEGEDISPEEYNDQKLWSRAIKAHDHLFAKNKSVDTTASPPGGTENGQGKNSKKETQKESTTQSREDNHYRAFRCPIIR